MAPHFVLVPGAWHPGWTWTPVARRLRDDGAAVDIVELPGQRLIDNEPRGDLAIDGIVGAVTSHLRDRDLHDVVLVGHSLGGYAIGGALASIAERVRTVIYYNAHIPSPGVSMGEAFAERMAPLLATAEGTPDASVPVPSMELLAGAFLPDATADLQALVADLLVPTPVAYFEQALSDPTLPSEHGIECFYILSQDDVILPPPAEQFPAMAGVSPISAPGGHESLITHPDAIADIIRRLVA